MSMSTLTHKNFPMLKPHSLKSNFTTSPSDPSKRSPVAFISCLISQPCIYTQKGALSKGKVDTDSPGPSLWSTSKYLSKVQRLDHKTRSRSSSFLNTKSVVLSHHPRLRNSLSSSRQDLMHGPPPLRNSLSSLRKEFFDHDQASLSRFWINVQFPSLFFLTTSSFHTIVLTPPSCREGQTQHHQKKPFSTHRRKLACLVQARSFTSQCFPQRENPVSYKNYFHKTKQ